MSRRTLVAALLMLVSGSATADDVPEAYRAAARAAHVELQALTDAACACNEDTKCLAALEPQAVVVGIHAGFIESADDDSAFVAEVVGTVERFQECAPGLFDTLAAAADASEDALNEVHDKRSNPGTSGGSPATGDDAYFQACATLKRAAERFDMDDMKSMDECVAEMRELKEDCGETTPEVLACLGSLDVDVDQEAFIESLLACMSRCM